MMIGTTSARASKKRNYVSHGFVHAMAHFEHGALNSEGHLVDPRYALQRTRYTCPDCHRPVHVKKGGERVTHFAHNPDPSNSCTYYNRNPSLDQRHRNAQLKLKQFLERGALTEIGRFCACGCHRLSLLGPFKFDNQAVKCEHRFRFNDSDKRADVAILKSDGTIGCIFEVVHTHYTREIDRPEPWHEIYADVINEIPSDTESFVLTCIRQVMHPECLAREEARRRDLDERRRRWEAIRRQREAEQEEANRRYREDFDRRERERQEHWNRTMVRARDEEQRLHANEQRHQEPVVIRPIEDNQAQLATSERQRAERHRQQMAVEEDHLRWEALHPRHRPLYRVCARNEGTCMMCSTGFRWEDSASLGRCQICNARIRREVERRIPPSQTSTPS